MVRALSARVMQVAPRFGLLLVLEGCRAEYRCGAVDDRVVHAGGKKKKDHGFGVGEVKMMSIERDWVSNEAH